MPLDINIEGTPVAMYGEMGSYAVTVPYFLGQRTIAYVMYHRGHPTQWEFLFFAIRRGMEDVVYRCVRDYNMTSIPP